MWNHFRMLYVSKFRQPYQLATVNCREMKYQNTCLWVLKPTLLVVPSVFFLRKKKPSANFIKVIVIYQVMFSFPHFFDIWKISNISVPTQEENFYTKFFNKGSFLQNKDLEYKSNWSYSIVLISLLRNWWKLFSYFETKFRSCLNL